MCRCLKGYLTVEASFIMPWVVFLYLLIILCGFYLYDRCVISQDNYLLAFRGSRFTDAGENYGEVIYGDMREKEPDTGYIEDRLEYKALLYPFYRMEAKKTTITTDMVSIATAGYNGTLKMEKSAKRLNIIEIVEGTRR
ncbi:MAG: TadE family protein [Suilimivivens sp.]